MIADCFTFFNELDILEIRLNELNDVVDLFVLVESNYTFTGIPKPLFYQLNEGRFEKFKHKIRHIVTNPFGDDPFKTEARQRNAIIRGINDLKDTDIVAISDVDEIINRNCFGKFMGETVTLDMRGFCYYFNLEAPPTLAAKICLRGALNEFTPNDLRHRGATVMRDGGWHLTYMGGNEAVKLKLASFSHTDYNTEKYRNPERPAQLLAEGIHLKKVEIDSSYPKFVTDNLGKFTANGFIYQP